MPSTIFAGIDISSLNCVLLCVDHTGKKLHKPISFENSLSGAVSLLDFINELFSKLSFDTINIGLESTSVYGSHIRDFLYNHSASLPYNLILFEINPSLIYSFKKTFRNKLPKTDNIDAFIIAERVRFGHLTPYSPSTSPFTPLKQLTRLRIHLLHLLSSEKNRALSLIFLKFSDLPRTKPFYSAFSKASMAVLNHFTTQEIASASLEDLISFIQQNTNNRLKNIEKVAKTLKNAARNSYRLNPKMESTLDVVLSMTLQNINHLSSQIKKLDKVIQRELNAIPQTLTTIPGIGPTLAAGIIAEIGDISRFRNQAALAQYAGLTWSRYQSGNFDAEDKSLTKSGNRFLRYYLVEAANSLRVHNEEYRAYYQMKYQQVPKHQHKRALVLTARKFVRLVFALLSKGQIYNREVYSK